MTFTPVYDQFNDLSYLIIPVSELVWANFDLLANEHPNLLVTSVDETKAVIKWHGDAPYFISLMQGVDGPWDHETIHQKLDDPTWFKHNSGEHHPSKIL